MGLRFIWIAYLKRRTSHFTRLHVMSGLSCSVCVASRTPSQPQPQPSVVLDGVTGHSRSLRNCQSFGLAQITPGPSKGGRPSKPASSGLSTGRPAFRLRIIMESTSNHSPHGPGPKNTGQSRFAQGHPARLCPSAHPPGLWLPHLQWPARIPCPLSPHFMSPVFGAGSSPKNLTGTPPLLRFRFARRRSPRGIPVGGMFCERASKQQPEGRKDHEKRSARESL
jgi:hypothetical protein